MINKIFLMGRIVREPELRSLPSGQMLTTFTVAVDRDYVPQGKEKETDFFDVSAWGKNGEFISKYFHKGSMILVEGTMISRKWEDKDHKKHTAWDIQMSKAWFGESKKRDEFDGYAAGEPEYKPPKKLDVYCDDEKLPF